MKEFAKMPSKRIRSELDQFVWKGEGKADSIAALMIYIAIVHNANDIPNDEFAEAGYTRLTYSNIEDITGLSRAKIASGLKKLKTLNLIDINNSGKTNVYRVIDYNSDEGWAKLPIGHLYDGKPILRFKDFYLRKRVELDALKLYLLLLTFRDNKNNHANIAYDKIELYTGIPKNSIRSAISLLVTLVLIQVDRKYNDESGQLKTKNFYRIVGLRGLHFGNANIK